MALEMVCLYQNHYVPALNINSYNFPDKIQMNNLKLEPTSFLKLSSLGAKP
jgi:hypothetical protein